MCSKLSIMSDVEVNETERKSPFPSEEDEDRLLNEEGDDTEDRNTTGDINIGSNLMWKAIHGLEKKLDLLAGTPSTCITDAPRKRKTPQTKPNESQNDSETPPGPSRNKQRKLSSVPDDASDDSDREVTAMLGEEEQNGDASDKLLQEIEAEYNNDDKSGPDVNVHLANLVNKRFAGKLKEAKLKEKFDLYVRPGNCDKLKVPLVNHELWGKLRPPVKSQDLRLANVQQTIVKATVALTEATDRITKGNFEGKQKIISSLTDSLALLGHATYDLSLRRRDIMRPSINKELRALCSQQIPVTEFLFGDDVQGSLKTIKECNNIASSTVTQGSDYKHKPSYSGAGHYRPQGHGSKPFLGQRKGYQPFKKKSWTPQHKRGETK